MTTRITIAAADVRVGDQIYNGPGASAHPTFAWETVTQANRVDGLILLITGRMDAPHGEFWFEPEEAVAVVRHPPPEPEMPAAKPHHKHGHGHSG
jgi:hypothetical protein